MRPNARIRPLPQLLLGLLLVLGSWTAAAQDDPLSQWERVESEKQARGPRSALPLSQAALRQNPDFAPLWTQYLRLHTSLGGLQAARSTRDSLQALLPRRLARNVDIFVALEEGNAAAAADTLRALEAPASGTPEELFWLVDQIVVALGSSDPTAGQRAKELLPRLESHPALSPRDRFAAIYMGTFSERLRALSDVRDGQLDTAVDRLTTAAGEAEAIDLDDFAMRAWYLSARLEASASRANAAIEHYRRSLRLATGLGDRWQRATTAGWLAWSLEQQLRHAEAFELRRLTVRLLPDMGDTLGMAYGLLGLGWDAIQIGEVKVAQKTLEFSLIFARENGMPWMECSTLNNHGVLLMNVGRYEECMQTLQRGLEIAETRKQRTDLLNNLAILYDSMQRPDQAIPIYRELLEIHRAAGDIGGQISVLNNLALSNESLSLHSNARAMYELSIKISDEANHSNGSARLNLARLLVNIGEFEDAAEEIRAILVDARRRGALQLLTSALFQKGKLLSEEGRFADAIAPLARADSLQQSTGDRWDRVPLLVRLARVLTETGQYERALEVVARAERIANDGTEALLPAVHSVRADVYLRMGRRRESRAEARQVLGASSEQGGVEPLGTRSIREIAQSKAMVALLRSAAAEPDPPARERSTWEAFYALQHIKSRTLLQYVQAGQREIHPAVPDSLKAQERVARAAVDRLAQGDAPSDSLRLRLAEARSEHQRTLSMLFSADERFRSAAMPPRFDAAALDALLREDVLILDWLAGRGCERSMPCEVVLFAVDRNGVEAHVVAEMPEVERQTRLLGDLLDAGATADLELAQLLLTELGSALLGPVAHRLSEYDRIILSPDGVLNQIPFAALKVSDKATSTDSSYLVELASLQVVPSLAVLDQLRQGSNKVDPRWDMVIWENDQAELPFAAREAERLGRHFARTTTLRPKLTPDTELSAELASLDVFGRGRILHFIAHGIFDDLRPWRSGLYLAGGDSSDARKLEIADVYALDFRSELVTLSACETAGGTLEESVGFTGFTQALLASGAQAVLAPLWSVDDASSPYFMSTYYEMLSGGQSKADALREAQLSFLRDDRLQHPYFWASYVLFGDGSTGIELSERPARSLPVRTLLLGVALLGASLWARRRSRSAG